VARALVETGDVLRQWGKPNEAIACYDQVEKRFGQDEGIGIRIVLEDAWRGKSVTKIAEPTSESARVPYSFVFPFGCPDCSPAKSVTVAGSREMNSQVHYVCCGKNWVVSASDWTLMYDDGSKSNYSVRACPHCHRDKAYYSKDSGKLAFGKCKNCGQSVVERDDW